MIRLVLILTSVVSLDFAVSFKATESKEVQESTELIFSNDAIAVESGQPVYPKDTKVWISTIENMEEIKLQVNEREAVVKNEKKIDLSKVITLESGTYTLVVNDRQESTFGFTIE